MPKPTHKAIFGNEHLGRLAFPLPIIEGKRLKKKCCKKYKKGKRCKRCPGACE